MREYGVRGIKDFLIIDDLCSSQKNYDEFKQIYDKLVRTEVTTEDWQSLEETILRNLRKFKDKWDVVRFIYRFLNLRYDYTVATRVAWIITKHFKLLFEKYYETYGPTQEGLQLLEQLGNVEHRERSKQRVMKQLDLSQLLSGNYQGVRA
uniref:Uncharacterized protein n=1 Tax=Thermococcus sp. CIR10 TaxID=1197731 RepID=L0BAG7_9EURY|nr:hypothetical protein [Thermococcus sp. CIR10]AFZ84271.1 hypothetical protein c10-15 [Thermococcus sp. CIR10]